MSNLSIYLLTVEQCHTLNERLLDIFKTDIPKNDVSMNKVIPHLIKLGEDLAAIVERVRKNAYTGQVNEADEQRDRAFTLFRDYCEVYSKSPDPKQAQAAGMLVTLIRRFGWTLYAKTYDEQTALQKGLIEALKEPEYAAAVSTIGAEKWVGDLKATNATFEQTIKLRDEQASIEDIPRSKEAKQALQAHLNPLLSFIGLMAKIEPQTYATLQSKTDEVVGNMMAIARGRQTRKENQQEEQGT